MPRRFQYQSHADAVWTPPPPTDPCARWGGNRWGSGWWGWCGKLAECFFPDFVGRAYPLSRVARPWLYPTIGVDPTDIFPPDTAMAAWHPTYPDRIVRWSISTALLAGSFQTIGPPPPPVEVNACLYMRQPDFVRWPRQTPWLIPSWFGWISNVPAAVTKVWTEPATAAITSTWTEPASGAITSTWTEPASSAITSTWTEPAASPITPSPEV